MQETLKEMLVWQASYTGLLLEVWIIALLYIGYKFFPKSGIMIMFELFFEKSYEFFEEISWKEEKKWVKIYIIVMFFVIILSNLMWLILDFLVPIFWENLEHFIKIPTSDINFNVAMAIIAVIIVIIEQFKALWFWKAIHEYVPITWMDLIPYERWNLPVALDWFVFIIVKFFDISISLFLWMLEIVGHGAKIISLSFRLFWNMTSWWILLAMLVWWISALTVWMTWFEFPIIGPVILYLQELLVAFIQALVFPLLVAIFIKVAKVH
jgi:F0F1-type ATP synthase membrane subunit a